MSKVVTIVEQNFTESSLRVDCSEERYFYCKILIRIYNLFLWVQFVSAKENNFGDIYSNLL